MLLAIGLTGWAAQAQVLATGGVRALSMGRTGVALQGEAWGHHNAGAWSALEGRRVGLMASQQYALSELRLLSVAVAQPVALGGRRQFVAAVTAETFGFEDYRETTVGLGAARRVGLGGSRVLHVGVHAEYFSLSIPDYVSRGLFAVSVGVQGEAVRGLTLGLAARRLGHTADDLGVPASMVPALAAALAYQPSEKGLVTLGVEQDLGDFPLSVRGGVEILPVPVLALRAGFTTAPERFSAGVGLQLGGLRADLAAENHQDLGLVPAIELGFAW
jgi:hypothetical protein